MPLGMVATKPGPLMAGVDALEIFGLLSKPSRLSFDFAIYRPRLLDQQLKASEATVPCLTKPWTRSSLQRNS